jgi:IS605 OrfB family transposase
MDERIATYQTRISIDKEKLIILKEYAEVCNKLEHALYAEIAKGKKSASCKNEFLKKHGVTARQFNACRVNLEGKVSACRANKERALITLKEQIEALDKKIERLSKKSNVAFVLHQKKRRRIVLSHRLTKLEKDLKENRFPLCFGSKKLFRAQFFLKENGYSTHKEWRQSWVESRNNEFFTLGSKDERSGNQTCTAILHEDRTLSLRLRLPPILEAKYGKYLQIDGVLFGYGHEGILASIENPDGQAISYRFKIDAKGWRVFASTSVKKAEIVSREDIGVIGLDVNADHIACIETDRFGNPVKKKLFSWISYGKSQNQLKAGSGEISKEIIAWAKEVQKPVVVEKLDFQKKKLSLREQKGKLSRLLSSFAYGLFFGMLKSQGYRQGIALHEVNPAFTSVIGHINYTSRYGLSIHLAAALCIARRYQQFSESPNLSTKIISDRKGCHVAFTLPVRNRAKHVWHFWGQVKKKIKTVLAAHYQATRSLRPSTSTLVTT